MTGLLAWSHATSADRSELSVWECTSPAAKVRRGGNKWEIQHERPWELQVQSKIRGFRPPYSDPYFLLVGRDQFGIGAVLMAEELDGPAQVELCWAGVARRHQRKGGGVADEMIRRALDEIAIRASGQGAQVVQVSGQIHEKNRPSQDMARRAGMQHTGQIEGSPFQQWTMEMHLHQDRP